MNYEGELVASGVRAATARAAASQAEAERDLVIRQASYHGGMTIRAISGAVGVSHQRVAQIINNDPIGPRSVTLQQAMAAVLDDFGTDWVSVYEIARLISERNLYRRRDGQPLPPAQVRARAAKHPELFQGSTDRTNRIRLRTDA